MGTKSGSAVWRWVALVLTDAALACLLAGCGGHHGSPGHGSGHGEGDNDWRPFFSSRTEPVPPPPPGYVSCRVVRVELADPGSLVPRADWEGRPRFVVTFSQPVSRNTVGATVSRYSTVHLELRDGRPGQAPRPLEVSCWFQSSDDDRTYAFIAIATWADILPQWPGLAATDSLHYTVRLDGPHPPGASVRDMSRQPLDGDANGRPGGTYRTTITAPPQDFPTPPGPCQVVSVRWDEDPPADLVPRAQWAGKPRCIIRFTHPVNPATVNRDRAADHCGMWITIHDDARPGGDGSNWTPAGAVFFSRDQKTCVYVGEDAWPPAWVGLDRLRYNIRLFGYDASAQPFGVKDARGQALDGDGDGRPGGVYENNWSGPAQR
jgi:hypothetical protein